MVTIKWKDNYIKGYVINDDLAENKKGHITQEQWEIIKNIQKVPNYNNDIIIGLNSDQYLFTKIEDKVQTGNWVGVISTGKENQIRIEISSRFDKCGKQYFLLYLLSRNFGFNLYDNEIKSNKDTDFISILIVLFLKKLEDAYYDGLYKTYKLIKHNDYDFKGVIDIPRHIARNTPFLGKTSYTVREYSYDNDVLCLIRKTLEYVKTEYSYILDSFCRTHDTIYEIENVISEATPSFHYTMKYECFNSCQNIISHPMYQSYDVVRKLCLRILMNEADNQFDLNDNLSSSILIDVAWLWEEFVGSVLLANSQYKHLKYGGENISYWKEDEKEKGRWYPDFIEDKPKTEQRRILDAKYKEWMYNRNDMHQFLAYLFVTGGDICGAIYPIGNIGESDQMSADFSYRNLISYFSLKNSTYVPKCYKMPFVVPSYDENDTYETFKSKMEQSISIWKNNFNEIIS